MYPTDDPRFDGESPASPPRGGPMSGRASEHSHPDEVRIELRAHCSLSAAQARGFLVSVAVGPTLTSIFCWVQGFWPVLPFAGLEFVLLWWALRWSMRRGQQREVIEITTEYVTINAQPSASQANTRFPRHWTKVKLRSPRSSLHPSRLCVESHGHVREVGKFLTDEERRMVAMRLQQLVGNMNESPALRVLGSGQTSDSGTGV